MPNRNLTVRFTSDTSDLQQGSNEAVGHLNKVATGIKAIATAGAVLEGARFLNTLIQKASDLGETTSKVGVIFGKEASAQVEKFGVTADKALGQSKQQAMDAAATFGVFGKSAGLAGAQLSGFSIQMATLASDMASFSNTSTEDAITAIGSAMQGESEPIRRYGVLLDDARLRQRAMALGIIQTTSEALTPQQRVLAAHAEILAQTGDAQGDFARTSGGLANQQRILAAQYENLATKVGQLFLPAAVRVVSFLNTNLIPASERVGAVLGDIGEIAMPVFKAVGDVLKGVGSIASGLPTPLLAGVAALVTWKLTAQGAGNAVGSAFQFARDKVDLAKTAIGVAALDIGRVYTDGANKTQAWAKEQAILAQLSGPLAGTFRGAAGEAEGFVRAVGGAASVVGTGLKNAVTGLVGFLGGPWGVIITGATLGLTALAGSSEKAKERQRELADAGKDVAKALAEQNGQINLSVRKVAAKAAEDKNLLKQAEGLGIATMSVVGAILNEGQAYDNIKGRVNAYVKAHTQSALVNEAWIDVVDEQGSAASAFMHDLDNLRSSKDGDFAATLRQAEAAGDAAGQQKAQALTTGALDNSTGLLTTTLGDLGEKYDDTASFGNNLAKAIKAITDAQADALDLEEGYEAALDDLTESIKTNGTTLDVHTEKGRANRDALEKAAESVRNMTLADLESGVPAQEAIRRHEERSRALLEEAIKSGMSRDEANKLVEAYSRIPKEVSTAIETKGYEEAWRRLQNLSSAQRNLELGIPIKEQQMGFALDGLPRASGGPIPGYSPHSKADNILLRATAGEFMQPVDAVNYYGTDFMEAVRTKQLPRYADGGPIGWPFKVNVSKTKIPELWSVLGAVNVGGAGVQRWAPLVLQALSMLGQPSSLLPNVLRRMNQESGGNPAAINLWDSNAAAGIPSKGLMQTIDPTFNAYAGPFAGRGIYDPLANIYAGLNYAIHRYPSLQYAMDKPGGYRNGGWLKPGGLAYNETSKPEAVFNEEQLKKLAARGGDKHYHLTVVAASKSEADLRTEYRRMEWLEG